MDISAAQIPYRAIRREAGRVLVDAELSPLRRVLAFAACVFAILAVMALDQLARPLASFGALAIIPVAAAAWFLPRWNAAAVVGLGLAARMVGVLLGGVDPITALADVASLILVAVALAIARSYFKKWREAETELQAERERQAAVAERERIGAQLPSHELRVLFGLTLDLEAAASVTNDEAARRRIALVVAELDKLITDLRALVFKQPARN